jgi:SM-20-related protein
MKHLKTTSDRNIWVFDDVFEKHKLESYQMFAQKSLFSLNIRSTPLIEHLDGANLQASFTQKELDEFGILNDENLKLLHQYILPRKINRCWLNLSTHMTKLHFHTDRNKEENGRTLLFYVHNTWDVEWGGETLFTDSRGDVEIAVSCKPNRVIVFDSDIPHKAASLTLSALPYRFTFAAQFI